MLKNIGWFPSRWVSRHAGGDVSILRIIAKTRQTCPTALIGSLPQAGEGCRFHIELDYEVVFNCSRSSPLPFSIATTTSHSSTTNFHRIKIEVLHLLAPRRAAKPLPLSIIGTQARTSVKMNPRSVLQNSEGLPHRGTQKLHGRAFYESIGSPKMIVAPMVDRSEFVGTCTSLLPQQPLTITAGLADAHAIVP